VEVTLASMPAKMACFAFFLAFSPARQTCCCAVSRAVSFGVRTPLRGMLPDKVKQIPVYVSFM